MKKNNKNEISDLRKRAEENYKNSLDQLGLISNPIEIEFAARHEWITMEVCNHLLLYGNKFGDDAFLEEHFTKMYDGLSTKLDFEHSTGFMDFIQNLSPDDPLLNETVRWRIGPGSDNEFKDEEE